VSDAPQGARGPTGPHAIESGPTGPPAIEGTATGAEGHAAVEWHDRTFLMHPITDHELTVLEVAKGNGDTTWLGVAIGAAITLIVVVNTVKKLSPYHHALFVLGACVTIVAVVYFAIRARNSRSLVQRTINEVRRRKEDGSQRSAELQLSIWRRCWQFIVGSPPQNP
jgi:hypothetical protein